MKFNDSPTDCDCCVRSITEALQAIDAGARVEFDRSLGAVDVRARFDEDTAVLALVAIGQEATPSTSVDGASQ